MSEHRNALSMKVKVKSVCITYWLGGCIGVAHLFLKLFTGWS